MAATFVPNNVNTLGMKLRRLASAATFNNPLTKPPILQNQNWVVSGSFSGGQMVNSAGNMYQAWQGGNAASGATYPGLSGSSGAIPILDHQCIWSYQGAIPPLATGLDVPVYTHFNSVPTSVAAGANLTQYISGGTDISLKQLQPEGGNYYIWDGVAIRTPAVTLGANQTGNIFAGSGGTMGVGATTNRLSVITDAPKFAFTNIYPQMTRAWVDGYPLWNGNMMMGTGSGPCGFIIDYSGSGGNRKHRLITVENSAGAGFGGIYVDTNSTVERPNYPDYIKAVFLGDSFTAGGNNFPLNVGALWPYLAGRLLGWPDVVSSGIGGTGLVAAGSYWNYSGRVGYDVLGQNIALGGFTQLGTFVNPDVVVVCGSVNDIGVAAGTISTAAATLYRTIRGGLPNALVIFTGVVYNTASSASATATAEKAIFDGLPTGDPLLYIMPISDTTRVSPVWYSGVGRTGYGGSALSGPGLNTLYVSGDGVHPTDWGYQYLAQRFAQYFRSTILPALAL